MKVEIELDIIQIWQKFTVAVTVKYVVNLSVSVLHNDVKCKILIIKVVLWHLYFVYFAKAINVDAELRKRYNVIIKQHETKRATLKFTKSEILITSNQGTLVIWGKVT